ncbi:chemotaxis protein CheB [Babesia caballi]|uniref:Chemotaxis protein CheB n=1 Tax=Babesia caballi TaxID=5871 RepID=A0AAV4LSP1_BABCB|nr:chemotaxis protein CheB [Babesia caballi]
MTNYGFKSPAMPPELIAELERRYKKVTPVSDGVVKIPPKAADVCGTTPPVERATVPSPPSEAPEESYPEKEVDKEKMTAKIASSYPNISPAFRILADSKLCLKGNNQSPEAIHRRGL